MSDFYNKYPYTDFHELNLDWVIERVKKLTEDWAATLTEWNNTEEEWHQLYDYVHDYFDNLDVQQEINNKIDQMILDGTFATIATPIIQNQVITTTTAWLADHITQPTTPVVDTSLAIAGAAADSKTVGDLFNITPVFRSASGIIDLDNAVDCGVYNISGSALTNEPLSTNERKLLCVYGKGISEVIFQTIIYQTSSCMYERSRSGGGGGTWSSWTRISNTFHYQSLSSGTDLDTVYESSYYILTYNASYTNAPVTTQGERMMLVFSSAASSNGNITQIFVHNALHKIYLRNKASGSTSPWSAWYNMTDGVYVGHDVTGVTDLNDMWLSGWYSLDSAGIYTNLPILTTGRRLVLTTNYQNTATSFRWQVYIHASGYIYIRSASGATWTSWTRASRTYEYSYIAGGTDLDTILTPTWFNMPAAGSYINAPTAITGDNRVIVNFADSYTSDTARSTQLFFHGGLGKAWFRTKGTGSGTPWTDWAEIGKEPETTVLDDTNYSNNGTAENTGTSFNIMSYNVAHYNNDTATYISSDQLYNFKKLISKYKPDFIGLQEDGQYLDGVSVDAASHLYKPIYPNKGGLSGTTIYSKLNHTYSVTLEYTNGRMLLASYYAIGADTLLFISTHPVYDYNNTGGTSAESIAERLQEYTELFEWINGDIDLNKYGTTTPEHVNSHDWFIICADTNAVTSTDRTNLQTQAATLNASLANGGWMGWVKTTLAGSAIDNIIVSSNVIINSVEVPEYMASDLYSDHLPIISNVTLL